jgi:hypothetical protein
VILVVCLRRHWLLRVAVLAFVVRLLGRRRWWLLAEAWIRVDVVRSVLVLLSVRVEEVLARVGRASVRRAGVDLALSGTLLLVVLLGRHRLPLLAHRQRPAQASVRMSALSPTTPCVVTELARVPKAKLVPEAVLLLLFGHRLSSADKCTTRRLLLLIEVYRISVL